MSSSDDTPTDCTSVYVPSELPNIVGYSVIFTICIVLLLCVYNERSFKKRPWLLTAYAFFIVFTIEAIDVSIVIWTSLEKQNDVLYPDHPETSKVDLTRKYFHLTM